MSGTIAADGVDVEAARLTIAEVAAFLEQHLGRATTAYISGVNDPKMVRFWIAGRHVPRDQPQIRLREAYQAARVLVDAYGDETAKAWFSGSNRRLDDRAPAYVLRTARRWDDLQLVVPAARAFAAAG